MCTKESLLIKNTKSLVPAYHFFAILSFGLVMAASRADLDANKLGLSVVEWIVLAVFFGIFCGGLFALFVGRSNNPEREYIAALGAIVFASGAGQSLGFSPLFVNCIFGFTLALFSNRHLSLKTSLKRFVDPLFVMIVLIASIHLVPQLSWGLALAPFYIAIRILILNTSFWLASKGDPRGMRLNGLNLSPGYLTQDLLLLAIALSILGRFPDIGNELLLLSMISLIASHLFGDFYLKKLLINIGEYNFPYSNPKMAKTINNEAS